MTKNTQTSSVNDPKIVSHHDMGRYSIDEIRFKEYPTTCFVMEGTSFNGGGISCI